MPSSLQSFVFKHRILVKNYEIPCYEALSAANSHAYWVQIFALGSCSQIPLACVLPFRFLGFNRVVIAAQCTATF